MNKIYKLIPKNLIKPRQSWLTFGKQIDRFRRIPYTVGFKRFNTYNYGREPNCEFCNDLLFFVVGMYFGYHIGKDKGRYF
jgi:hypothetical protein